MKPTVTQCKLVEVGGARVDVAFIDSRFRVGEVVTIDDMLGKWRIVERYADSTTSESEQIERSRDHARQHGVRGTRTVGGAETPFLIGRQISTPSKRDGVASLLLIG